MQPAIEPIRLPAGYGTAKRTLDWGTVRQRLEASPRYWLATTRPDGRPHVVPVDGVWVGGVWYFGGHPDTVHQRNLRDNQEIVVHLEDTVAAVIAEGRAERTPVDAGQARELAAASERKYGYAPPPAMYEDGVWSLRPRRVLAWEDLSSDPTRFTFD
jgi:nitroimidazol reductase NimA-like FMN-containing flavoprotein (pyridoxamine 5'-phosphate oxidase superfamily)